MLNELLHAQKVSSVWYCILVSGIQGLRFDVNHLATRIISQWEFIRWNRIGFKRFYYSDICSHLTFKMIIIPLIWSITLWNPPPDIYFIAFNELEGKLGNFGNAIMLKKALIG